MPGPGNRILSTVCSTNHQADSAVRHSVVDRDVLYGSSASDLMLPTDRHFSVLQFVCNAVIVAAVGPQVFGVPMSFGSALKLLKARFWLYVAAMFMTRLAQAVTGFCIVFPAILVTAYIGHLPEALLLERTPGSQVMQRLSWLSKGAGCHEISADWSACPPCGRS